MIGRPCRVPPSAPPVRSYSSAGSRAHWLVLGAYSPSSAMGPVYRRSPRRVGQLVAAPLHRQPVDLVGAPADVIQPLPPRGVDGVIGAVVPGQRRIEDEVTRAFLHHVVGLGTRRLVENLRAGIGRCLEVLIAVTRGVALRHAFEVAGQPAGKRGGDRT